MKTFITVLLVISFSVAADEVQEIRDYYNEVKELITSEFGLYRTTLSINDCDMVYPALGHYMEEITFYWGCEAGYKWLVLAVWSGEFSMHREYGEVLFSTPDEPWEGDTGELLFEFVSFNNSDEIVTDARWWYSGGELLQSSEQTTYPDTVYTFIPEIPEPDRYSHNPEELMEMFLSIHS
jgi:hypothetical protein